MKLFKPRWILRICIHKNGEMGTCQRPLRANTPQGERISLACSETVPAGTTMEFTAKCLVDGQMDVVREWLDYGKLRGFSQWRNAGKGRFEWEEISETSGNVVRQKRKKKA